MDYTFGRKTLEVLPPEQAAAAGLNTGEVRRPVGHDSKASDRSDWKRQDTWEEEDKVASAAAEEEPTLVEMHSRRRGFYRYVFFYVFVF